MRSRLFQTDLLGYFETDVVGRGPSELKLEIEVVLSKVPSSLFNLEIEPWEHISRGTILMQQNPNI